VGDKSVTAELSDTPGYDPRYDRAQTLTGAKARYVQLDEYTLANLDDDVERILREGENPDQTGPIFEGQRVF